MSRRGCFWLALSSLLLFNSLGGAVRPRYGGILTVELSGAWTTLDPGGLKTALVIPIAEPLVRVSSRGEIQPVLAVAWQHDPDFKRWRFSLRQKVTFHDGEALTAVTAAPALLAALKPKYGDVSIEAGGQAIEINAGQPMPELLQQLALPDAAIFRKTDASLPLGAGVIGTGPFRVTAWEPGRRLKLAAFDDYWGGRPYLDGVAIEFGPGRGRADLFDIAPGPARRILAEGVTTWSSEPRTLLVIASSNADPAVLQALAPAIDRAPLANVLAQHKAEAAFGVLPQWLSGYAFLFESPLDANRARRLASEPHSGAVALSYPPNDLFLRSVAERVALNARDAGIAIQPTPNANGQLRLVQIPLESADAAQELKRIAEQLGAGEGTNQLDPAKPETLYQFERSLLDAHRILPLVHLRETFGIAPRVHFQAPAEGGPGGRPMGGTVGGPFGGPVGGPLGGSVGGPLGGSVGGPAGSFALHLEDAWLDPRVMP